jgi:hypothetical protein
MTHKKKTENKENKEKKEKRYKVVLRAFGPSRIHRDPLWNTKTENGGVIK